MAVFLSLHLCGVMQADNIDSDVFVEVLGCLANLTVPGFDWLPVIARHDLLNFLTGTPVNPTHAVQHAAAPENRIAHPVPGMRVCEKGALQAACNLREVDSSLHMLQCWRKHIAPAGCLVAKYMHARGFM